MSISLQGFAWDGSSSFSRGTAQGPLTIRSLLFSDVSSHYSLDGTDVRAAITHEDFSDLPSSGEAARQEIRNRINGCLSSNCKPLSLGGDHSISFPILEALRDRHGPLNVLHIDAHPDMYDELGDDPFSHACPFRRAIEAGCINSLVQVGLRSVSPDNREFGKKHGVIMLSADEIDAVPMEILHTPLYVSIDLDGIDPAFAPGVSHPEPGGLTSREVIRLIGALPASLVGADIVELNPAFDVRQITAHLAVRLAKELTAKLSA